ncbi:MAG: hypothetical protein HC892_01730 [Saprospiraceae bacterium]|nr:hypothetical protein [Saprospiraceae bacterium]
MACDKAITFFESLEIKYVFSLQIFLFQKALACLQLKRYDEGKEHIVRCIDMYTVKSGNWFWHTHAYVLLCFHSGDYQQAQSIFEEVSAAEGFGELATQHAKESWKIVEAYLYYLNTTYRTEIQTQRNFRVTKFINEVPEFSKDKRVTNIPILIVQILLLLHAAKKNPSKTG